MNKEEKIECEICGKEFYEDDLTNNRCPDCFEYWGDEWPDRL